MSIWNSELALFKQLRIIGVTVIYLHTYIPAGKGRPLQPQKELVDSSDLYIVIKQRPTVWRLRYPIISYQIEVCKQ